MPRWGRPPGARMGRHTRGRTAWEDMTRVEEVESTDDERYAAMRDIRMRQLDYGGRGTRRWPTDYEDLADSAESVDGGDYDLHDYDDSTVAYAVQLAMRDKEDQLVEKALERIRRAQMLGQPNVRLSQRELEALERKRLQTDGTSWSRRPNNNTVGRSGSRRTASGASGEQLIGAPVAAASHRTRPTSSSSATRPRTPTTQSLRPQHSSSPLHPPYSPLPGDRLPPPGRPQSMPQHLSAFARPLPDDPQWAPSYYNPAPLPAYAADHPAYQPQMPPDLRAGAPRGRMSYPSGMPPYPVYHHRASLDGRSSRPGPAPSETESDVSSEEEEEEESDSSEGDDDEVQIVDVVQRQNPGVQRRVVSGGSRGRRGRPSR